MDTSAERGRRLYDWYGDSGAYALVDRLSRSIRMRAVRELGLDGGETVLDVGCGPGRNLAALAAAVGRAGRVVALDYSEGMTHAARGRETDATVSSVIRGDARTLPLGDECADAALASLALSAVPEPRRAVEAVRDVLRPGGRFVVFDGRVPDGPLAGVLGRVFARVANWQGNDVLAVLREAFASVEVVATYDAGAAFVAVAERA